MTNKEVYRKLIEAKKQKLAQYREFESLVTHLANYTTNIGEQLDQMTTGAQGVKEIVENWELVLQSISLASSGLTKYGIQDIEQGKAAPEPLVRVRLLTDEEIQEGQNNDQKEEQEEGELDKEDQVNDSGEENA
ncbi:uncharacterized protein SPAPADRAFT_136006 [Spathaspora passalidarum NRRL Y-27907]|uniref:DASH complex subunit DAD2 n=1 Tax=Spathaspora passalidarum (strain NRRL Y-27907 / 11-Y1) TaxID=619300 RepID=G3ALR4_SPAPN|nr:uncharacterized protein SPAPADRAFT_136006 [Spathaspora passalidarum NRRL Y-27907]EGW33307.1 hypothetical protein SPAPADRAFT_136006 [Spathaspora passalidarum NRRL Y-27907]